MGGGLHILRHSFCSHLAMQGATGAGHPGAGRPRRPDDDDALHAPVAVVATRREAIRLLDRRPSTLMRKRGRQRTSPRTWPRSGLTVETLWRRPHPWRCRAHAIVGAGGVPTEIRNSPRTSTEPGDDTRERPNPLEARHLTCQMQSDAGRRQSARFDPVGGNRGATTSLRPARLSFTCPRRS